LHRFGVDRGEDFVWGYVKEKAQADAEYRSHVYEGSREDPALLEWWAPGLYRARLYPINPGATRRVVSRYAEWLARTGEKGERRHYVYPMAADGAEATLPRIEELTITIDLSRAQSHDVRVGMDGVRDGQQILVRRTDFVPRADLSVELYDDGIQALKAYRSKHEPAEETLSPDDRLRAKSAAANESDYLLVPVKKSNVQDVGGGLDLAIVVDASAGTDEASLSLARAASKALLAHLGSQDRAAIWATDTELRAIAPGLGNLRTVDQAMREETSSALARIDRGGATDLGAVLSEAAIPRAARS
jgi:Ca-activated chloride channel family protein